MSSSGFVLYFLPLRLLRRVIFPVPLLLVLTFSCRTHCFPSAASRVAFPCCAIRPCAFSCSCPLLFVSGDSGLLLLFTDMVWSCCSSSSAVVAASLVIVGEIITSIVCDWGDGAVSSTCSDIIGTNSEPVGEVARWISGSGGASWLSLFGCSCDGIASHGGLLLRIGAYSELLFLARRSASSASD